MKTKLLTVLQIIKDYSEGNQRYHEVSLWDFHRRSICPAVRLVSRFPYVDITPTERRDNRVYLQSIFHKWPKFSGDEAFPVPATNALVLRFSESPNEVQFMRTDHYWTGEYGQLRKELLDFCIQYLTEDINREANTIYCLDSFNLLDDLGDNLPPK